MTTGTRRGAPKTEGPARAEGREGACVVAAALRKLHAPHGGTMDATRVHAKHGGWALGLCGIVRGHGRGAPAVDKAREGGGLR